MKTAQIEEIRAKMAQGFNLYLHSWLFLEVFKEIEIFQCSIDALKSLKGHMMSNFYTRQTFDFASEKHNSSSSHSIIENRIGRI